jgi:tRNA U34 5-carboxymethylaminomethyl modifying GTPase MnmE/TrmE
VSAEEGTTRDIVDVTVDIGGWLCRLGDMAGLRGDLDATQTPSQLGAVEQEGIRRARERALHSDVVVALLSVEKQGSEGLAVPINEQVLEAVRECHAAGKIILVALNKSDLVDGKDLHQPMEKLKSDIRRVLPMVSPEQVYPISCRAAMDSAPTTTDPGRIQAFLAQLTRVFAGLTSASVGDTIDSMTVAEAQAYWAASLSVTHRQSAYLEDCRRHLNDYLEQASPESYASDSTPVNHSDHDEDSIGPNTAAHDQVDIVTAAEHLRFAAGCLAKITGKGEGGDVEDVLGVVFEK